MIAFCGQKIEEADVLDVYGLVAAAQVEQLAAAVAAGDHRKIVERVDEFDAGGRDLFRLLADLQTVVRRALLDAIRQGGTSRSLGTEMTTEQLTRMLDALHEGESGVKSGLSEKINFEITLLKAVEGSRARALDSVLKEIAALAEAAPASEKKKELTDEEAAAGAATGGAEEGEPVGPSAADEAALISQEGPGAAATAPVAMPENRATLPSLESLVSRIPQPLREALDEQVRARFVRVRRLRPGELR
jgi:DNA polymerase III gamma/tau subunit